MSRYDVIYLGAMIGGVLGLLAVPLLGSLSSTETLICILAGEFVGIALALPVALLRRP